MIRTLLATLALTLSLPAQVTTLHRQAIAKKNAVQSEEFNVEGATYYAVAPAGYSYNATQDANYGARKYNTLSAAEAGLAASPTTPQVINILGDWSAGADTTPAVFAGVTTTADNHVLVRCVAGSRHTGVWGDDKYRLSVANASALVNQIGHLRVDGLQIGKSSSSANLQACFYNQSAPASSETRVSNCIFRQAGNASFTEPGLLVGADADCNVKVWNTIVYGSSSAGVVANDGFYHQDGLLEIYSCVAIGGARGVRRVGGTLNAKNVYATGSAGGYSGTITMTTCASSDTTGSAGLHSIAHDATTFVNVTGGSQDYHLGASSPLIGVGTDTSGDASPFDFTTDIDGEPRVAPWDVGADQN